MVAQLASMRPVFSSFSAFFQAFSWRQTYLFHSRSSMHRATTLHRLSRPVMKTMFVTFFIVQLFSYFGVSFFPSSCKLCERSGFSLSSAAATRFYSLRDISDGPKYSLVNSKEHSRLFNNNFNFMVPMFGTEVSFIASRAVATHLHYGGSTSTSLHWSCFLFSSSSLCSTNLFSSAGRDSHSLFYNCVSRCPHHCLHAAEAMHLVNELWGDFDGLLTGIHSRFFILRVSQLSAQGAYPVIRHDIIFIVRPREFENLSAAHAVCALPRTRHALHAFGQSMATLSSEQSASCIMFDTSCTQFSCISLTPSLPSKFSSQKTHRLLSRFTSHMYYMFTTYWTRLRFQIEIQDTPRVLSSSIARGINVDKFFTSDFVQIFNFQHDDHQISTPSAFPLLRSLLINFRPGFSMSIFLNARAIREDVRIYISSIDYHCIIASYVETKFLEFNMQLAQSSTSDTPSQHARHDLSIKEHKLSYKRSLQPSELKIAQALNLPRARSAVPSVDTVTEVALWGASLFTARQRLLNDHQSSTYFIILNFSNQETPSSRPSADGAPHYDFEQGHARTLSEFTEVSGEGAGKLNAEFIRFRLSCRYDFEYGRALNLLAIADVLEPSHAHTLHNLALKLLAIAAVMEHGHACKLPRFAVVVEDEPFISKTDLTREAIIAEEHLNPFSFLRTTCGSYSLPTAAAISDLKASKIFLAAQISVQKISAAKFFLSLNFVVLTHSFQFSVMSLFSQSLHSPPLQYGLLPMQLTSQNLLLTRSAGDSLSMANFSSAHTFTLCNMLINRSARGKFSTASLSLMQFNFTHVLLNRLAGDNLSRNSDIPAASFITRPSGSIIRSAGDNYSRLQCAHRLDNFQLMKFLSTSRASSEQNSCVLCSMKFLCPYSELSMRHHYSRVFPSLIAKVVRLHLISAHYSHATIFSPADTSTTTHNYFKACFCAPSCVNQRDYLTPSGDNLAATSFYCSCTSTFVGHYFQFGLDSVFSRHLFDNSFTRLLPPTMILQCDNSFQYFNDFVYAERSLQSFSSLFKTQLFPDISLCLSIFTLSTNIIDRHFRRARIDFLTRFFLQVIQQDKLTEFGLGNERPSSRRAGSSHEELSLSIYSSPSTVIFSAIQQSCSIFIFAISSMVESSLVWAIKGRQFGALAHSATSSLCFSSFAFELI